MFSLELFRRFLEKNENSIDPARIEKEAGLEKDTLQSLSKNSEIDHIKFHDIKKVLSKYGYSDFLFKNSNDPKSIGITFWAVKGGTGKTTLTKFVGYALAHLGCKVLIIDNDHQCNLTHQLIEGHEDEVVTTVFDLYQTDFKWKPVRIDEKIDLIPGSVEMAEARDVIKSKAHAETRLRKAIEPYRFDYDYILIDSRPDRREIMVDNTLTAVDYVFTPLLPDSESLKGVDDGYKEIRYIREEFNHMVQMGGIILNQFRSNTNVSSLLIETLKEDHPEDFIESIVSHTVSVSNQTFLAENIFNLNSKSKFKDEIISLTSEIIKRTKA